MRRPSLFFSVGLHLQPCTCRAGGLEGSAPARQEKRPKAKSGEEERGKRKKPHGSPYRASALYAPLFSLSDAFTRFVPLYVFVLHFASIHAVKL